MHIIVVGCGRVGSHLATLLSNDGHNVAVIDRRGDAFDALGRDFNGMTVKGVGFDEDTLRAAGIENPEGCDAVAAVTSNDDANLMIAEVARQIFGVKHVITRLYAPRREMVYTKLNIDYACGTTLVAEEIFAKIQAGYGNHISTFGDFEVVRCALSFADRSKTITCRKIEDACGGRVMAYEHDENTYMATSPSILRHGDEILMCIERTNLNDFYSFLEKLRG